MLEEQAENTKANLAFFSFTPNNSNPVDLTKTVNLLSRRKYIHLTFNISFQKLYGHLEFIHGLQVPVLKDCCIVFWIV